MSELSREQRLNSAFVAVADTLVDDYDIIDLLHTLVETCAGVLDVDAVGIMLADGDDRLQLLASTSEETDFVEIMQLDAGAGPCVECFHTGQVVSVDDIAASAGRWPEFQAAALQQGFHSVFATPLRLRRQVLGTMNMFNRATGRLNDIDIAAAQALADVAAIGILQERSIRETTLVTEQLQHALESRVIIEQAKGVIAVLGEIGIDEAFGVLRGYARRTNQPLRFVAEEVIARRIDVFDRLAQAPGSAPETGV
jgi:GAF domain-containing protein